MDEFPLAVSTTVGVVDWQTRDAAPRGTTLKSTAELELLASDWESVASALRTPIQQFIWVRAAVHAFGDDALRLVVMRANGRVTAIAPLVIHRRGFVARLELIGIHALHEPMDCLYSDSRGAEALAREVCRTGVPIRLERIPADSAFLPALQQTMHGRGFVVTRAEAGCPWIPLDAGRVDPIEKFHARRRSDLRRMQRLAESLGTVNSEVVIPTPENARELLEEAFRVEAESWKGRTGTALATDTDAKRFFLLYASDAVARGILRVAFLRIDGRAVAMQIAAECSNRLWLLKIGYDESCARCSPGSLLMLHTLRYAAGRGLKSYEFLGTDESWPRVWTTRVRPYVSVRTYPANPRGLASFSIDALVAAWMKTQARLRPA